MRAFQSQAFARNPTLVDFGALCTPYWNRRWKAPRAGVTGLNTECGCAENMAQMTKQGFVNCNASCVPQPQPTVNVKWNYFSRLLFAYRNPLIQTISQMHVCALPGARTATGPMCMQWDWGLERFASLAPPPQPRQFRLTTEPQNTRPFEFLHPWGHGQPPRARSGGGHGRLPPGGGARRRGGWTRRRWIAGWRRGRRRAGGRRGGRRRRGRWRRGRCILCKNQAARDEVVRIVVHVRAAVAADLVGGPDRVEGIRWLEPHHDQPIGYRAPGAVLRDDSPFCSENYCRRAGAVLLRVGLQEGDAVVDVEER